MKIIVDLRALAGEQVSGVKIYLQNLLDALFRLDTKNTYFLWFNSATENFPDLKIPRSPRFKKIHTKFSNRALNFRLAFSGAPALDELVLAADNRREFADIFWLPDPRPVAISENCKLVATVHDISPTRFPQFFSVKTRIWHKFLNPRKIAQSADQILAVSEFTKSELENFWKISREKISVTLLAAKISGEKVNPRDIPRVNEFKKTLPRRFALALSTIEPRKNLATLVRAFAEFKKENPSEVELLIAGSVDPKIFANPKISEISGVRFLGQISEDEKADLLARAEVFCFPSIYEGFGLPPLEAAAAGAPVLAADIPPLRESLGEAAQFLSPQNPDAWSVALAKIFADKNLRAKMSAAGKLQSAKFSWEKTVRKTLAAFEDAVK